MHHEALSDFDPHEQDYLMQFLTAALCVVRDQLTAPPGEASRHHILSCLCARTRQCQTADLLYVAGFSLGRKTFPPSLCRMFAHDLEASRGGSLVSPLALTTSCHC